VRVILGTGAFSWQDTRLAAAALAIFSFSILAQSMIGLLSRSYYAGGRTTRPLTVNSICSVLIIILSPLLLYCFNAFPYFRYFVESMLKVTDIPGTAILMLPLAYSIGTILNFILHWIFVKKDFMDGEPFIAQSFFQSLGASFLVGFVAYLGLNAFSPIFGTTTFLGVFLQGFLAGMLGIMAGFFVLYLLKNKELRDLIKVFKTKIWRVKIILPAQEEL
jgi:peptidoglycan biosynthesis protein MviN/MurJ (putative lipid II flippase)